MQHRRLLVVLLCLSSPSEASNPLELGTQVVFAPFNADEVVVFDTSTNNFSANVSTGSLTRNKKFRGAASVGTQVVFAPLNADAVGIFDTGTNIFSTNVSTGSLTILSKFSDAASVGTQVVFAPLDADVVGVFDTSTNIFSANVSTESLSMLKKFRGAASVGTQVVFAPFNADAVGVFDTSTNNFSTSVSTGSLSMLKKFAGAASVGTQVVFAPFNADVVGVFDTSTNIFSANVSTGSLTMLDKFKGAASVGTQVVFAPFNADAVGVFDTSTNMFSANVSTGSLTMDKKFCGAASVGTQVVFAPHDADVVGVFDTRTNSFSISVSTGSLTIWGKFDGIALVTTTTTTKVILTSLATPSIRQPSAPFPTEPTTTISTEGVPTTLRGEMTISVSDPAAFLNEPNVTGLLRLAIAELFNVSWTWVHNVSVSLKLRRILETFDFTQPRWLSFVHASGAQVGDVDVRWYIITPADGEISVMVLYDRFDSMSIAAAAQIIQKSLGELEGYNLTVTWKFVEIESDSGEEPTSVQPTDKSVAWQVYFFLAIVGVLICLLTIVVRCLYVRHAAASRYNLMSRKEFEEIAGPYCNWPSHSFLFPPDVITAEDGENIRRLGSAIFQSSLDDCEVYISYAVGQRPQDADGVGPGMFFAAAVTKHMFDNGVRCFSELMFPEECMPLKMHLQRCKVLIVVLTKALYDCRYALEDIYSAQQDNVRLLPLRFEDDLPNSDNVWPQIVRSDLEGMLMVSQVQSHFCKVVPIPTPPYTLQMQPRVLNDIVADVLQATRSVNARATSTTPYMRSKALSQPFPTTLGTSKSASDDRSELVQSLSASMPTDGDDVEPAMAARQYAEEPQPLNTALWTGATGAETSESTNIENATNTIDQRGGSETPARKARRRGFKSVVRAIQESDRKAKSGDGTPQTLLKGTPQTSKTPFSKSSSRSKLLDRLARDDRDIPPVAKTKYERRSKRLKRCVTKTEELRRSNTA